MTQLRKLQKFDFLGICPCFDPHFQHHKRDELYQTYNRVKEVVFNCNYCTMINLVRPLWSSYSWIEWIWFRNPQGVSKQCCHKNDTSRSWQCVGSDNAAAMSTSNLYNPILNLIIDSWLGWIIWTRDKFYLQIHQ